MARSLSTIYNSITATKESNTELDNLLPNPDNWTGLYSPSNFKLLAATIVKKLSVSKLAIWRLIAYIVAFSIWTLETLFDQAKEEITDIITNNTFGQLPWYVEKAKAFQLGDPLEFIDGVYQYSEVDEDKKIITQASSTVSQGIVLIKVATGELGSFAALTTTQLDAFTLYMKGTTSLYSEAAIAPAGIPITIISSDPDDIRMHIDIFVDTLVIDTNGYLVSDGATKPVEVAVQAFIQQLPFDATFRVASLTDTIQAITGVNNVVVKYVLARTGSNDYTDVMAEVGQKYVANSGYINTATDHDLDGYYDYPANTLKTLNYIADA